MKRVITAVALSIALFGSTIPAHASAMVAFLDECLPTSVADDPGNFDPLPPQVNAGWCGSSLNSVRITLDGNALDVEVEGPYESIEAFGFNINGSTDGLTISNLSPGYWVGDSNVTGTFGTFDQFIYGNVLGPLSFTLSRDLGFTSPLDIWAENEYGWGFGARLGNPSGGSLEFATDIQPLAPAPVPEPGTMLLLATGLAAAWRHRRMQTGGAP